ncbi:MAG TPA: hypothetical protein VGB91_04085 [Rhizomicrobium sp.]
MSGERVKAGGDLLQRLQAMLYEYYDLGRFEEARPHILWLMEIAEKDAPARRATLS